MESGPCTFYYLIDGNVCFLTLAEKGYPKKLAFQYLDELAGEFSRLYGSQVDGVTRPYAFIKFGKQLMHSSAQLMASACLQNGPWQPAGVSWSLAALLVLSQSTITCLLPVCHQLVRSRL